MTDKPPFDYHSLFTEIDSELRRTDNSGKVANYIPELAYVDPDKLGMHLVTCHKRHFCFGDSNEKFSIQSISKVYSLTLAFRLLGDTLWSRVGVEPSGSPFNSLVQLEYENGMPRNPFINAGAIVVADILVSQFDNPKEVLLNFVRELAGNKEIDINPAVFESEKATGFRNRSLINLMKSYGNIKNDIEVVLDLYFFQCAIEMTCRELAQSFSYLANDGINPIDGKPIVSLSQSKRINAIMQLCGFYDEAGEFSFKVGLPGKSGVGGGIIAVLPGRYSICVWSPRLNEKGNSFKGMKILELLTTKTQTSVF